MARGPQGEANSERRPDEIDNSHLTGPVEGTLKAGLAEGVDFVALPKSVWAMLVFRYSAAPVIPRVLLPVAVEAPDEGVANGREGAGGGDGGGEGGGASASAGGGSTGGECTAGESTGEDDKGGGGEFVIRSRGVGDERYHGGYNPKAFKGVAEGTETAVYVSPDGIRLQLELFPLVFSLRLADQVGLLSRRERLVTVSRRTTVRRFLLAVCGEVFDGAAKAGIIAPVAGDDEWVGDEADESSPTDEGNDDKSSTESTPSREGARVTPASSAGSVRRSRRRSRRRGVAAKGVDGGGAYTPGSPEMAHDATKDIQARLWSLRLFDCTGMITLPRPSPSPTLKDPQSKARGIGSIVSKFDAVGVADVDNLRWCLATPYGIGKGGTTGAEQEVETALPPVSAEHESCFCSVRLERMHMDALGELPKSH